MTAPKPNPGSHAAIELGCRCPQIDNHHGQGWEVNGVRHFVMRGDCPLHGEGIPAAAAESAG